MVHGQVRIRSVLIAVAVAVGFAPWVVAGGHSDSPSSGVWATRRVYYIENSRGVYPFADLESGSFVQRIVERSPASITIEVRIPDRIPHPAGGYPLRSILSLAVSPS